MVDHAMIRTRLINLYEAYERGVPRLRGLILHLVFGIPFRRVGRNLKLHGASAMSVGKFVSIGDGCWIEAVTRYQDHTYSPRLVIGSHVSMSNWTHISCVQQVSLGDGCLLGSKVFIGDHSHGSVWNREGVRVGIPGNMPLEDFGSIVIGAGTWIGDGAVILAGTRIGSGSVVGANSVVKLTEERAALIAGAPARVVKYLN